jgi:hypothetical protein
MKNSLKSNRGGAAISEAKFRQLVEKHFLPLLSGAEMSGGRRGSALSRATVAFHGPCALSLKPSAKSTFHVEITRSQAFASASARDQVTEYGLANSFVHAVQIVAPGLGSAFERDILKGLGRRIVARAIAENSTQRQTVLSVLDQMSRWAARSYEGKPISAAIGVSEIPSGKVRLYDVCKEDFSVVLSNGADTMIECSANGNVLRHHQLSAPRRLPDFAPHRLAPIAKWAIGKRIGIALNRNGEILVLKHGKLVFVCRRGKWSFLSHEPIITQMGRPQNRVIRKAVYSSALDASFARTGACIGLVTSGNIANNAWKQAVPKLGDHLQAVDSIKTKALAQMIGVMKFQDLDRRFRQELLAIDGATLIGHDGTVLAVGAILRIEGGSTGGGRIAAAKTLSQYGLGIKVSQDGPIEGFRSVPGELPDKPTFSAM